MGLLAVALFLWTWNFAFPSTAQDRLVPPKTRPEPCRSPLRYRIGKLDPRFGISREDFRRAIEEAGDAWATAADKNLFQYDEKGKLGINLVYDTRQEITQRVITVRAGIVARMKEADSIEGKLTPLQDDFRTRQGSYADQLASYRQALGSYNQKVKNSNIMGGAPEVEFQRLAEERLSLKKQNNLLEAERLELNRSADEINVLVKKHNALLVQANTAARTLNSTGSAGVEFEEGRYIRAGGEERVDIFQFEDRKNLLVILSHELGHALGMKHNPNPSSIMSPLIHTDQLALTAEDRDDLEAVCSLH